MKEFKINSYITAKLETGKTNIYINGVLFRHCKYLILKRLKINDLETYLNEFKSIDEESENLDHSLEHEPSEIPPKTEFWAHCSNLQVWAEHNYNTDMLHYSLSFDLLKKLAEVGDIQAKKVFKDEIIRRFLTGYIPVFCYLFFEGFLKIFSLDEIKDILKEVKRKNYRIYLVYLTILLGYDDSFILYNPKKLKKFTLKIENFLESGCFTILHLRDPEIDDFVNALRELKQKIKIKL